MENLLYFALTVFAVTMMFAYRHNLKHFVKEVYYGKENYTTMKSILYGNYDEFLEGCYKLINFERRIGCTSYRCPSENEKKMIMEVLRSKGWLMKFLSDVSKEMRSTFIYPHCVEEAMYFQVK